MKTPQIFGLLVIGLVLTASAVAAFGYGRSEETRTAIQEAIAAGDYDTWKEAMTADLTQERFEKLVARHQEGQVCFNAHEAIQAAIEDDDYDAWLEATQAADECRRGPTAETLTEDDFELLVQLHQARADGDDQTAQELAEELGIPGQGFGMGGSLNGMGPHGQHGGRGMAGFMD